MKIIRNLFFLAALSTTPFSYAVDFPYSNDLTTLDGLTVSNMSVVNGELKPSAVPSYVYVTDTTGWSKDVTVGLCVNMFPETKVGAVTPQVLAGVTDASNFYMYRLNLDYANKKATAEIYNFWSGGNSRVANKDNITLDTTKTEMYYRLNTLSLADGAYLVGEASYDADFSTILNRTKVKVTEHVQAGNSAGIRSYTEGSNATFNDLTVQNLTAWTNAAGGAWETAGNWSNSTVPNGPGTTADFSMVNPTVATTVTVTGGKTVGRLIFGDTDGSTAWTLSGDQMTLNSGDETKKAVITVEKGSSLTVNNQLVSVGNIALNGGGTLNLTKNAGNALLGNWYVSGGSTLTTDNNQNYSDTNKTDEVFGSGKIYLDGSTLHATSNGARVSNDIVVSGNSTLSSVQDAEMYVLGNISGSGNLTENVTWSLYFYGDNSAYTGNWTITGDYVWSNNKYATKQDGWAGDGDYSFGSGTITINGGALGLVNNNGYIWNDIIVPAGKTTSLVKLNGTNVGHLTGNITGEGTIEIHNNNTSGTISLEGDNSAFNGMWKINARKVITHNTNATKVNGGDTAFGTKQMYIGTSSVTNNGTTTKYSGCIEAGKASTYIHNPINISGELQNAPFSFEGKILTLTGG